MIEFHLLNFLQSAMTLLKTLTEKLMRASMVCRSGIVMRSSLCIGVNQRVEPPVTPYLSRLQRVRTNQILFSGHHIAWSDQSFDAASADNRQQCTTVPLFTSYIETTKVQPAADLGMFSMFGRTGAPTKRGSHKRSGKFLHARNNGRPPSERKW